MIEVRDLVFRYSKTKPLITPLDLTIKCGTFTSIIGRSGCGKTTLIKLIAGLIRPQRGKILLDGEDITGEPNKRIGIMFQKPNLLPWRTVKENIFLPLKLMGNKQLDYRHTLEALVCAVGLEDRVEKYPFQLSEGQKQRVSLARVLIYDPEILLLDEPFAAVDAITRWDLRKDLQDIWMSKHKTVLLVTHDIYEAAMLSDDVMVMKEAKFVPDYSRTPRLVSVKNPRPRTEKDVRAGCFDEVIKEMEESL